ncbi:hypothetical protein [Nocardiopsis suaedae]|uniref:4Fe-4S Wbl-type domain-containing protein n=1 Tax=Nocardiopsis suaedae TaxID=3018444 RepID=A0ABT4TIC8_9ACTN|nr:hypothetical protein [Nocardiopsis suaedae]MDA2804463.1 hypothetical protein [Nocardiopsis suaedae]
MPLISFGPRKRVAVICDRCGPAWADDLAAGFDTTFSDADTARRVLTAFEWTFADDRVLCGACTVWEACGAECDKHGHVWADDLAGSREVGLKGEPLPGHRYCRRCGTNIPLALADGTGHPEQVPGLLTEAQAAALIAMELHLREGEG